MSKKHSWTETDDITALYLYRFGTSFLPYSLGEISKSKVIKPGSMRMRIQNFKAIDTGKGLAHFPRQSEQIYDRYCSIS